MRVLIVEDEPIVAGYLESVVEGAGHAVAAVASSVPEALGMLNESFDAALLDCNLQGVSASPVAEALRQRRVPFIVMSGYQRTHLPPELIDAPYLPKPSRGNNIRAALNEIASALTRSDTPA